MEKENNAQILKKEDNDQVSHEGILRQFIDREIKDIKSVSLWRATFAELVGTFILFTWTIGMGLSYDSESPPPRLAIALTAGLCVGTLITSLETVSGGHVNPAISIGFLATGKITLIRFLAYSTAHAASGIAAPLLFQQLYPSELHGSLGLIQPGVGITPLQVFLCEFLQGFFLLFGTFAMIDPDRNNVRGSIPLFVGFIVIANVLFGFNVSGGCMNPARNFGPALLTDTLHNQWAYWCGPLLGGVLGSVLYEHVFSVQATRSCVFSSLCRKSRDASSSNLKSPDTCGNGDDEEDEEIQETETSMILKERRRSYEIA